MEFAIFAWLAVLFHLIAVVNGGLLLTPLWNTSTNTNTSTSCSIDYGAEEIIYFQGHTSRLCSLQVQVTPLSGMPSVLQLLQDTHVRSDIVYIERFVDPAGCKNRYVVIKEQAGPCYVSFKDSFLQINLQGNTSLSLSQISANASLPMCPNDDMVTDSQVNQTNRCYNVKEYNETITCDFSDGGMCNFHFPSSCDSTLGDREVTHTCLGESDQNLNQNQTVLMIYPPGILYLDLHNNHLIKLDVDALRGLDTLITLDLSSNQLHHLPLGLFSHLPTLHNLYLSRNLLVTLQSGLFLKLGQLSKLSLGNNLLYSVPVDIFKGLANLSTLYLYSHAFKTLDIGLFDGLKNLKVLYIVLNYELTSLPGEIFQDLQNLSELYLYANQFVALNSSSLHGLSMLTDLSFGGNRLSTLPIGLFRDLRNLNILVLRGNQLISLNNNIFQTLNNLETLFLNYNLLTTLHNDTFIGLTILKTLFLNSNNIVRLDTGLMRDLHSLRMLLLSDNKLTALQYDMFQNTKSLRFLDLSENKLIEIPNLRNMPYLKFLNMKGNNISKIPQFSNIQNSMEIIVNEHEICECYVPIGFNCSAALVRSPYLTCHRLLSDTVLEVVIWIIGLNALGGNLFVLAWRKKDSHKNKVQTILMSNLALSDLLMGVYMIMIASADIYYGDLFPLQAENWRSGVTCRIAGSISILSGEASVFFVTLISIDRFMSIKHPHSRFRFGRRSTIIVVVITWIFSLVLGIAPSALAGVNYKFYDNSHVCIGLPLAKIQMYSTEEIQKYINIENTIVNYLATEFTSHSEGYVQGLYFSTAMFLGLNSLSYIVILACYIDIIRTVHKSSKRAGLTKDMKEQIRLTAKVAAIVITDFICWCPIIVLGILVQAGVLILPPSVFAWSVTVVLPINSAINPYLYTIAAIIHSRSRKIEPSVTQASRHTRDTQLHTISNTQQQRIDIADGPLEDTPNEPMHQDTDV